jgi:hypothetical protein
MEKLIQVAKHDPRQHSREFWMSELDRRAAAIRKSGMSHQHAFARVCETPDGTVLLNAHQAAEYEQPDYVSSFSKAATDRVGDDTATARLSKNASNSKGPCLTRPTTKFAKSCWQRTIYWHASSGARTACSPSRRQTRERLMS